MIFGHVIFFNFQTQKTALVQKILFSIVAHPDQGTYKTLETVELPRRRCANSCESKYFELKRQIMYTINTIEKLQ